MAAIFYTLATLKDKLQNSDKERGATAVEYGIMVAAIAAVIIGIVFILGTQVEDAFKTVSDAITNKGVAD